MQIIIAVVSSLIILWAFEIRHRDSLEKLEQNRIETERIKDSLAKINNQLKAITQKLNEIGLST